MKDEQQLVEQAARAICAANFARKGAEGEFGTIDDCWWAFKDEALAALSILKPEIEAMREERQFLLDRADAARSCSFGTERWTGMSSNALVAVAFGRKNECLPGDGNDLSACYLTVMRMPPHLRSDAVFKQLERGEQEVGDRYPDALTWARENAKWPGSAALNGGPTNAE